MRLLAPGGIKCDEDMRHPSGRRPSKKIKCGNLVAIRQPGLETLKGLKEIWMQLANVGAMPPISRDPLRGIPQYGFSPQ